MNYYPYYVYSVGRSPSFFSPLFNRGNFSFNSLLNGVQRTLTLVNRALPIIKEAAPTLRNAKTMFKVMNEFKKVDGSSENNSNFLTSGTETMKEITNYEGPTFFA